MGDPERAERQQRAEQMVKTIYVHANMDEDTWEVGRAMRCPDQVPVSTIMRYAYYYQKQGRERFAMQKHRVFKFGGTSLGGADRLGRDLMVRCLAGGGSSLGVGLAAAAIASASRAGRDTTPPPG